MLVLSRKPGEKILVGDDIVLTIIEITGNRVRLGIDAPDDIRLLRSELCELPASPRMSAAIPGG